MNYNLMKFNGSSLPSSASCRPKKSYTGSKVRKIIYGFFLIFSLVISNSMIQGVGIFSNVKVQEASAQLDTTNAFFASPGTSDFLSLALAIMPTVPGADLNVSDVTGSTNCDLLVPITYVDAGCMTSLPLLTPITYQPNMTLPVNNTVYYTDYNQLSTLAVLIGLSSDNITAGETQTITVTVSDENLTTPVSGAVVDSNITDSYGTGVYEYSGVTDETGQTSFDYAIPDDALSDFYDVTVYAYADGYDNATSSTVFEVIGSDYDDFYDNSTTDDFNYDDGDGDYDYDDGSSSSSDDDCCDYDSPTVKSVDPQDDENNVPLDTKIKVTFDEKMDQDTLDDGSLQIFNLDSDVEPNANADASSKSVTYTLDRDLLPGTRYEAELDFDIQDEDGNYLDCTDSNDIDSSCRWQFETTGTSVSTSIALNSTSGPVGTSLTITGTGFDPTSSVSITFGGSSVGTVTSGTNGGFIATFPVPQSSSGSKSVEATQGDNLATTTFTVTSAISLNPPSGQVDTTVTVTGTGFAPSSEVTIKFNTSDVSTVPSPVTPSATGAFSADITVPDQSSGPHTVTASQGSNSASATFIVTPEVTVSAKQKLSTSLSNVSLIETPTNQSDVLNATGVTTGNESNITTRAPSKTTPESVLEGVNQTSSSTSSGSESNVPDSATNETQPVTSVVSPDVTAKNEAPPEDSFKEPLDNQSRTSVTESESKSTETTKSSSESQEQDSKDRALFEKYLRSGDMGPEQGDESEINNRPVAKGDEAATVQNVPIRIDILANDKDADGKDELKIIGISPPNSGKVDLNSDDSITYLPEKEWMGKEVFDYTISDGNGGAATASVVVTVGEAENNIPKVESETISVNENNPQRIKLKATDVDERDRLMFKILKEPSHGKIAEFKESEGTLVYLPDRNYEGRDGFEFIVTDGKSESKEGQITIEIKPGKDLTQGEEPADQKQQQQQEEQSEKPKQSDDKQSNDDSNTGDNTEDKDNQQSTSSGDNKVDQSEEQKQQDDQPKEEQEPEPPKEEETNSE